ncbi:MAG: ClpXP protease specificity-enhancing factor [Pseudomonadales bacterium]|nr:ClpXP protease specificity-enhancing factor [Pseudomonadales bacterium]
MTSSKPYMIRAIYEWLVDNGMTPHVVVWAAAPGVDVPQQHVHDGRIVFNVAPAAVHGLQLNNEAVTFSARFGGKPTSVYFPVEAVLAVYARENGQGMFFEEETPQEPSPPPVTPTPEPEKPKPALRIVK